MTELGGACAGAPGTPRRRRRVIADAAGGLALALGLGLGLGAAAGCDGGGPRLAECDALLATAGKVATCRHLDASQRSQLRQAARTLEDALDRLAGAGADQAPAALVSEARKACATQAAELQKVYEKDVPDCLR